jgi:hypothetical protein
MRGSAKGLSANFGLACVMVQITDDFSSLIDQVDGRLTVIFYRFGPSRKREHLFALIGLSILVRDLDAFLEPMRDRHCRIS